MATYAKAFAVKKIAHSSAKISSSCTYSACCQNSVKFYSSRINNVSPQRAVRVDPIAAGLVPIQVTVLFGIQLDM